MKKMIIIIVTVVSAMLILACGSNSKDVNEETPAYSEREKYLVGYAFFLYKTGTEAVEEQGLPVKGYWEQPDSVWMPYAEPYLIYTDELHKYWIAFSDRQLPYDPLEWAEIVPYAVPTGKIMHFMVFHSVSGSIYEIIWPVIYKDGEEFVIFEL